MPLIDLLRSAGTASASDLHFVVGHPPMLRVHTIIEAMDHPPLDVEDVESFFE